MKRYKELEERFNFIVENLEYPPIMSSNAKSLIAELLVIDPVNRLGYNGAEEIKHHRFFASIDWEKMNKRHISPPFVPSVCFSFLSLLIAATTGQRRVFRISL